MTIIYERQRPLVHEEGPREITPNNVIYWCKHSEDLKGSQRKKAAELLAHDCVKYVGDDPEFGEKYVFIVLPLNREDLVVVNGQEFSKLPYSQDYNSSTYKIRRGFDKKTFVCNCQGWHARHRRGEVEPESAGCSHVLALYYAFKCKRFGGGKE